MNLSGRGPSILLRKTVLSLKSPTGAFIAPLRCANANLSGRGPSILLRKTVLSLKHPTGVFVASQTRTFENTPLSSACKKTQGKLWQKERGLDGASPLDRIIRCSKPLLLLLRFSRCSGQNGNKKSRHKTDQLCLRFFWKVMLVGYVTA